MDEKIQVAILVIVALIAFGFAYTQFAQGAAEKENTVNGIKVFARGSVKSSLAQILSPQVIATQVVFDNASDNRPCKVPMQTEALYGLVSSGKNASLQIFVADQKYCLKSAGANSSERVECAKPQVVIQTGECDCMRVDTRNQTILVSGSESWLCSSGPQVREIIAWGIKKE